ncbi:DUF6913 domain-containing protein [Bacteroidota bacterium]
MSRLSNYIGYQVIKRRKKNIQRDKGVQNFDTANSAVIVFDTEIPDSCRKIKEFVKFLKSNDIKTGVIGLVAQKETPEDLLEWQNFKFLTKRDITFYGKPKKDVLENFFNLEPELLFVISFKHNITIEFLTQLSKAKFKVGCFKEEENDLDLMIKPLEPECKVGFFLDQVKHYVKILTPSNQ